MRQATIFIFDPRGILSSRLDLLGEGLDVQPVSSPEMLISAYRAAGLEPPPSAFVIDGDPEAGLRPESLGKPSHFAPKIPSTLIALVGDRPLGRAWIAAGAAAAVIRPVDLEELRCEIDRGLRASGAIARSLERESALRAFFAMYAHDLKNPLVAITGYCELALSDSSLSDELRGDLEKVLRNVELLNLMAKGLLEMVRGPDALRVVPRDVRLGDVLRETVEMFHLRAGTRGIRLDLAVDDAKGAVRLDPSRMIEALGNIIDNAIKFSPEGGTIGVSGSVGTETVEIAIDDEGPGIDPGDRDEVFVRFNSAAARAPQGNLGLGLSIAREIVELHGGSIRVMPRDPRGTRMAIRIPRLVPALSGNLVADGEAAGREGSGESVITEEVRE